MFQALTASCCHPIEPLLVELHPQCFSRSQLFQVYIDMQALLDDAHDL